MKKKKMQRAISTLLLCAVVNTTTPAGYNNLGTVFASLTSANEQITFGESIFNVSFEKDSGSAPSDITISPSNLNTGEVKYPTFLQTEKLVKNKASKWSEKMVLGKTPYDAEYTSVTIPSDYQEIPQYFLELNEHIQSVNIATTNDITLKYCSFFRCKNLKNISISAPNKKVVIETSAFRELASLENVNITAGTIVIKNAFSECSPKNLAINGSLSADSVLGVNALDTLSTNETTSLTKGFVKDCTIQSVSLGGTTKIDSNCFSGCTITNLNLEGTTTLESSAFSNKCNITNMSVNGKTIFANKTLDNCTVKNLYFNLDNRNNCGNVSYMNGNDRLGYNSKVNNIYFNYADIQGNTGKVQELNNFPLGGDIENTSLNCDNIFFCDSDFKYISETSSYKRTDGGKTIVYGWGGAMAWDTDGNRKSAYDMYKEWMQNETCTFYNYVNNTNSGKASDVFELKVSEVYIPDDATSIAYDFSNTENITAWANFEQKNNQFAERNEFVRANGYTMKPITMNTEDSATAFATNFNYRILKKDDSITGLAADKYNYFYSSEDAAKGWYTALTTKTDNLTEGNNYYLIEVGGVKYPFTIVAKYNKVEKIDIEGAELQLDAGEKVTPEMLKVTATYTDGTTEILPETAYEIMDHTIVEGQNTITVRVKAHASSDEYVTSNFIAMGYKDICTGFKASTAITQLYEGGTLNVSDVVLSDVTYANPSKKDENVTSGFKFLVNGQESDTCVISKGVNSISIVYKGYIYENAIIITGMVNTITKVEAAFAGSVYEGMQVPTGTSVLAVRIYENNATEGTLLTDNDGVTLDAYQIVPGVNLINVYYKGIRAVAPIQVTGLSDYATQITSATYKGSLEVGYCPVATDIELQAIMASGRIVDTQKDNKLKEAIVIQEKSLEANTAVITITFKSAVYMIPIRTNAVLPTTEAPTQSADTVTPMPTATVNVPVSTGGAVTATQTPQVSQIPQANTVLPTVPVQTATPTQAPVVTTQSGSSAPNTSVTAPTDNSTGLEIKEVEQSPAKGHSYTVNGVKYKVMTVNSSKKTGDVAITGYVKNASVKVLSKVKIKGYTFTVTSISNKAFSGCNKLKTVVIGSKVKSIGSKSFYNCKNLKVVDLRKASVLSKIGAAAFKKNAKKRIFKTSPRDRAYIEKLLKGKK